MGATRGVGEGLPDAPATESVADKGARFCSHGASESKRVAFGNIEK